MLKVVLLSLEKPKPKWSRPVSSKKRRFATNRLNGLFGGGMDGIWRFGERASLAWPKAKKKMKWNETKRNETVNMFVFVLGHDDTHARKTAPTLNSKTIKSNKKDKKITCWKSSWRETKRNETKPKRDVTKQNETKSKQTKPKPKRNEAKQTKRKQELFYSSPFLDVTNWQHAGLTGRTTRSGGVGKRLQRSVSRPSIEWQKQTTYIDR